MNNITIHMYSTMIYLRYIYADNVRGGCTINSLIEFIHVLTLVVCIGQVLVRLFYLQVVIFYK